MSLTSFGEEIAKQAFNRTKKEAHEKKICIYCGQPIEERIYSQAGEREYQISGMCEICFYEMFQEGK